MGYANIITTILRKENSSGMDGSYYNHQRGIEDYFFEVCFF